MTPPLTAEAGTATRFLHEIDPILAAVIDRVGPCVWKSVGRPNLFQALLRSIIYQQLHGRAAATIHGRVLALMPSGRATPAGIEALSDELLRGAGLSGNKLLAIRDLAAKTRERLVPSAREAEKLTDDELIERLSAVRGIGPWTVQMLLIFHLGRPDVLPTGDFAIKKAFSQLYRKGRPVTAESLVRHARRWQPHRSVASWYLWRSLDPGVQT